MGKDEETPKPNAEEVGMCANCGELASHRCANCRMVFYCKKECQISHWKSIHKEQCKPFQVRKSRESNYCL